MHTKIAALALTLILALLPAAAGAQEAAPAPPVGMASGILIDLDNGKILWAREDQSPRAPASLTKILTALVVLERIRLTEKVVITPEARYVDGARLYAEEGWTFPAEDLMWGLLLQSGNDAAVALGQRASPDGSIAGFIKLMNERAAELGASDSDFRNPHGLDEPGHSTSARALAMIAAAAMRNKTFSKMVATRTHQITWGDGSARTLFNGNKLLSRYPGAVGIKTGFTAEAGHALASAVRRDGTTLLAIVLGSPDHYQDSTALYDWAFANLAVLEGNPLGAIHPDRKKTEVPAAHADSARALEVVQYDPAAEPAGGSSAPLVVPLLVLTGAILAGQGIRKRLRSRPAASRDRSRDPSKEAQAT